MSILWSELRQAARSLTRTPGVTVASILTLALGIGANATIFAVVWGVLLRPLDLPEPGRLVTVWENHEAIDGPPDEWTGYAVFNDWRQRQRSLTGLAAFGGWAPDLTGIDRPQSLQGKLVTPGYFEILGVSMALGRGFLPEEEVAGNDQVVVLSHGLWQSRFAGDQEILGQTLTLAGSPYSVVGVLPEGFQPVLEDAEIWAPLAVGPEFSDRGAYYLRVVGRLAPEASLDHAAADLSRVARELAAEYPTYLEGVGIRLIPLHRRIVGNVSLALWVLLGAVGLVLLIACVNVANLLLARALARRREFGVRTALGASRWRLTRQLVVESALIGAAGGAVGVAIGVWGLELFRRAAPADIPRLTDVSVGWPVLLVSLAAALIGSLLFGLLPALGVSRGGLQTAMAGGARGGRSGDRMRLRGALVIAELALGLALLVGAGLLIRSLASLTEVDPGFRAEGLVTSTVRFPPARIPEPEQARSLTESMIERLAAYPGVSAVGGVAPLPLAGGQHDLSFGLEHRMPERGKEPVTDARVATAGYFETMGIPLLEGRLFRDTDDASAPRVMLVSRTFADRYLSDREPLGQRMRVGGVHDVDSPWLTVVGVVGSVRDNRLELPPDPEVYVPFAQRPIRGLSLVVRADGAPEPILRAISDVAAQVDPDQAVASADSMERIVARALAAPRFLTGLLVAFGALALTLAAVGIYGLMANAVGQRTREIGIRIALGAHSVDILGMVLRWGALLIGGGVVLGLGVSFGLGRALGGLLFGVRPHDPLTLAAVSSILALVALGACWFPARRAARVDPMKTLRSE